MTAAVLVFDVPFAHGRAAEAMNHVSKSVVDIVSATKRRAALESAHEWVPWFRERGPVRVNLRAAKRREADDVTTEFIARVARLDAGVLSTANGGRMRRKDPVARVNALLMYAGFRLTERASRLRTQGVDDQVVELSIESIV